MIRDSRRVSGVVLLLAILSSLILADVAAYAGDSDGVQGYSMKLKKTITTFDGDGSNGLIVGTTTSQESGTQGSKWVEFLRLPQRTLLVQFESMWVWMTMRSR